MRAADDRPLFGQLWAQVGELGQKVRLAGWIVDGHGLPKPSGDVVFGELLVRGW